MQKAYAAGENILKFAGMAKGIWDTGKMVYSGLQAAAPYARATASAISLL